MYCYTKHRQNLGSFFQGPSGFEGVGEPGKEWEKADTVVKDCKEAPRCVVRTVLPSPAAASQQSCHRKHPRAHPQHHYSHYPGPMAMMALLPSAAPSATAHRSVDADRTHDAGSLSTPIPHPSIFSVMKTRPRDHSASGRLDLIAKVWTNVIDVSFNLFRVSGWVSWPPAVSL